MNYEITEGDVFLCVKDYLMDDGEIAYTEGEKYISEIDGCITCNNKDYTHGMLKQPDFFEHFKLL